MSAIAKLLDKNKDILKQGQQQNNVITEDDLNRSNMPEGLKKMYANSLKPVLTEDVSPQGDKPKLKPKNTVQAPSGIEEKLDMLLAEVEALKKQNKKLLAENHIVPKSGQKMYIQIGGHLFEGEMNLIESQ